MKKQLGLRLRSPVSLSGVSSLLLALHQSPLSLNEKLRERGFRLTDWVPGVKLKPLIYTKIQLSDFIRVVLPEERMLILDLRLLLVSNEERKLPIE